MLAACSSDGRQLKDPVYDLPAPPVTEPVAAAITTPATLPTLPPLIEPAPESIVAPAVEPTVSVETLSSPANATAEMVGTGAQASDPVTVDDEPAEVLSFEVDEQGRFVVQVWIDDEGAHTVCVGDGCARVYTLAADAESAEEVIAKIEQAKPLALAYFDSVTEFPEWTVEIAGALAGTGGTTDADTKTVRIYRNRGRSVDDFVRSILHEFGHVIDAERLDEAERVAYLELRGVDPSTEWSDQSAHRLADWARQPSEDFAEVMVMIWSDGQWVPRTELLAPAPTADALADIELLVAP
jgi:hypothetical protein